MKQLLVHIDEKLHKQFKDTCTKNGQSMSHVLAKIIQKYLEQ